MLEARALTLTLAGRTLCTGLTARLEAGQTWAILGSNGSGKTTLLHALAGLRATTAGEILLDGAPLASLSFRARARRLGVLLQDYDSSLPATALEIALTGRHPHLDRWQWNDVEGERRARAALQAMDLVGFEERLWATLSGGERRRTEIAALLVQDPPICLLDEPTNHLDLRHQISVLEGFAQRAHRPGHLNLMVLHDVNLAIRFATHGILLFSDGVTLAGPTRDILTRERLEELYGCPLREGAVEGRTYYFPA